MCAVQYLHALWIAYKFIRWCHKVFLSVALPERRRTYELENLSLGQFRTIIRHASGVQCIVNVKPVNQGF
jgi:hypothetical protein